MKFIVLSFLMLFSVACCGQSQKGWTADEKAYYETVKSLCNYFNGKKYDSTHREKIFKDFVYFDNILKDTSKTKIDERTKYFDHLFTVLLNYVDSVGYTNVDMKPIRFFKGDKKIYPDFDEKGDLKEFLPITMAYYDKRIPLEPKGVLLFEPKTKKLWSWVVINQGGYKYFLTFNLL